MADLPSYIRPKIDGWLKRFWKQKEAQLTAIGMDPELDPLGCGHYGCVFATMDPRWVIKITRDPTEGPIAAKVTELRNKREAQLQGIVLFKEIYKADETVEWRGKTWPVYVTVRESVKPYNLNDAAGMRRYKKKNRGFDPGWDPRAYEFISRTALDYMKEAALKWHEANDTIREAERTGARVNYRTQEKLDHAHNDYADWASKVGDDFPYVGETVFELLDEGIVLRDVHWANLGYTTWEGDEATDFVWRPTGTTVIHDLGHTPTDPIESQFKPLGEDY